MSAPPESITVPLRWLEAGLFHSPEPAGKDKVEFVRKDRQRLPGELRNAVLARGLTPGEAIYLLWKIMEWDGRE